MCFRGWGARGRAEAGGDRGRNGLRRRYFPRVSEDCCGIGAASQQHAVKRKCI